MSQHLIDRGWAIRAESLGKQYLVTHEKNAMVRGLLPHLFRPRRVTPFWALRDVSFSIPKGQCVGLLGPNGAGKSTLLAVLAGITAPLTGSVETCGRVAPMLSLGAGFHPELTGEENLWLNGSLLGMSDAQLRDRFRQIAEFAGLDGFLDAPLATYSTGMQMRLGFAIAIHADADVLLIDEVMAVGDQAFQATCVERLHELKRAGKTLVIAAHSIGLLEELVDRALLFHRGQLIADGTFDHVQQRYTTLTQWLAPTQEPLSSHARAVIQDQVRRHDVTTIRRGWGQRQGTGEAEVETVRFLDAEGRPVSGVPSGAPMTVALRFVVTRSLPDPHIGVAIFRDDGTYCYGPNTRFDGLQFAVLQAGVYECRLHFDALHLTPGGYHVSVAIWDTFERSPSTYHQASYPLAITGVPSRGVVVLAHTWSALPTDLLGAPIPQLVVEGPLSSQVWYRTFESLTFTALLPTPPQDTPTLLAECRGPNGELWWASQWSPPAVSIAGHDRPQHYRLQFPRLMLLTGLYRWSIGWERGRAVQRPDATAMRMVEVVADRHDHGLAYLAHRWEVRPC